MQIKVSGHQIELGVALTQYVEDHLAEQVQKHFNNAIDGAVVFSKTGNLFSVAISVNEGVRGGIFLKSTAEAANPHLSFDLALDKLTTRLRRYHRRIKNYRHGKLNHVHAEESMLEEESVNYAQKYILPIVHDAHSQSTGPANNQSLIAQAIEEKQTKIEKLSVEDAIMQMDLASLPALLFLNYDTGRLNLVYHRADGNVSWIDPEA